MIPTRVLHYTSALGMIRGLKQLFQQGLRPRDVLFLAFDTVGDVHLAVPERPEDVGQLRVGEKLTLTWPIPGRMFHLDAAHPLGGDRVVINGDRRIGGLSSLVDVAALVSWFVRRAGDQSIFFGCTPHPSGSWWVSGETAVPQHTSGFVDIVLAPRGLLARRSLDSDLYFLPLEAAVAGELEGWQRVYRSPLGSVLMLERRVLDDRLVLSCEGGLVELDLSALPAVRETGRIALEGGYAVLGRITRGAFAVTRGEPMEWGYDDLRPATLVGSDGCSFLELPELLRSIGG